MAPENDFEGLKFSGLSYIHNRTKESDSFFSFLGNENFYRSND